MKGNSEDGRCRRLKSYEVREIEKGHAQEKNRGEARSPLRESSKCRTQISSEREEIRRNKLHTTVRARLGATEKKLI